MHVDRERRSPATLSQTLLSLDSFKHARPQPGQALRDRKGGIAAFLKPLVIFKREGSFFVMLGRALGEVVGKLRGEIDEALFALAMKLVHPPSPLDSVSAQRQPALPDTANARQSNRRSATIAEKT